MHALLPARCRVQLPPAFVNATGRCSGMRIHTQVLDGTYGKPAAGVSATLSRAASDNGWSTVGLAETDDDGRIADWDGWRLEQGLYRIVFDSDSHFAKLGVATAYPEITVIFRIQDESQDFQVQITLSPYSYSTYFGTVDDNSEHQNRSVRGAGWSRKR
jgi:5-hydroxyisourate hydrolase